MRKIRRETGISTSIFVLLSLPPLNRQGKTISDPVTKLASVWVGLGVVVTTVFSEVKVVYTSTRNELDVTLNYTLIPITTASRAIFFFAQPRRAGRSTMMFLRIHFFSFMVFREGERQQVAKRRAEKARSY